MMRSSLSRAAAVVLGFALVASGVAPTATAAGTPATSAYGIQMLDADGGTLQAPAPLSEWTSGDTVSGSAAGTDDVFRLNTTRTTGLDSRAASDGAQATVASGTFQLRDRVPVAFTGLRAVCATDGSTSVAFDSLTVDGKDVLDRRRLSAGYTIDLPVSSTWGSTRLIVGERTVDRGRVQVTGLRIEAEAGWSEIWRVRLGVAACAPSPTASSSATVTGVGVTAPGGAVLLAGGPHLDGEGTATAQNVRSAGSPSAATDVAVSRASDGSASVSVGTFTQIPDTSEAGEYLWSALRVYGLRLAVTADGTSQVSFADTGSAVFVNGVWINTGTDLYTGVDATGTPRVRVHLNERVAQADGSVLITALRYEDLTGTYPSVRLGTVRWTPSPVAPTPTPEPTVPPTSPLPPRYAFAVDAEGPSVIAPALVSDRVAQSASDTADVSDGLAGQIALRGASTRSSAQSSAVTVDELTLYPGSGVEVTLRDLALEVTGDAVTLTSGGGTVAGRTIPAGAIAPGTVVEVPGRSLSLVLNAQTVAGDARSIVAVEAIDAAGLGAHVRVGVITTDAPAVRPEPEPTPVPTPDPGSTSPGSGDAGAPGSDGADGLAPGPIGQNDPWPTAAAAGGTRLPATGTDGSSALILALAGGAALLGGTGTVLAVRRRRVRE